MARSITGKSDEHQHHISPLGPHRRAQLRRRRRGLWRARRRSSRVLAAGHSPSSIHQIATTIPLINATRRPLRTPSPLHGTHPPPIRAPQHPLYTDLLPAPPPRLLARRGGAAAASDGVEGVRAAVYGGRVGACGRGCGGCCGWAGDASGKGEEGFIIIWVVSYYELVYLRHKDDF